MSTTGDEPSTPPASDPAAVAPAYPAVAESVDFAPAGSYVDGAGTVLLPPPAPVRRRRRIALVGGLAAVVLVGGAGALWAASMLSGGGAQPDTMVPSTAIAYANIDLDPSAGQKVAAFQFIRKFPLQAKTGSDDDLIGEVIKNALGLDASSTVDYDRDIKPWLGKRAAVAVVPSASGVPDPLIVLQVTDEAKARVGLRALLDEAASQDESSVSIDDGVLASRSSALTPSFGGVVVRDGFALIGSTQEATQTMSTAAANADLASSATYGADVKRIENPGVASTWVDLDALSSVVGAAALPWPGTGADTGAGTGTASGRLVAGVRFDGGSVEVVAHTFGGSTPAATTKVGVGGQLAARLPADATAALVVGDTSDYLAPFVESVGALGAAAGASGDVIGELEDATGLTIPDDLETLLGDAFAVVVGDVSGAEPQVAALVTTSNPNGSVAVLDKLLGAVESQTAGLVDLPVIARVPSTDGIVYGSTTAYATSVAGSSGLGQDANFLAAVPDANTAASIVYINLDRVRAQVSEPEAAKNLEPLRAIGLATRTTASDSEIVVRVVTR